jgi:hypothetical protein
MPSATELAPGLLWWQADHPDWPGEDAGWGPKVTSYALAGDQVVLFDPLSPPAELARTPGAAVLLTCPWHGRGAASLAEAGAEVYAPQPPEGVAGALGYEAGDTLPGGVQALAAFYPGECALWLPEHRALVVGESLYGVDGAVRAPPPEWLPEGASMDDFRAAVAPFADLEPAWLLPAHGEPLPDAAAALRAALGL